MVIGVSHKGTNGLWPTASSIRGNLHHCFALHAELNTPPTNSFLMEDLSVNSHFSDQGEGGGGGAARCARW